MGILVSKFGGSSLADAAMFKRVRDILSLRTDNRYIIVSAPGKRHLGDEKITDLLCRAHRLFASGQDGSRPLGEVVDRFCDVIRTLQLDVNTEELFDGLEEDVRRSADLAASRGEYLCARLFSIYADLPFADAAGLVHFDENGLILREKIAHSIRAMAGRLSCAVIPGFYGSLPSGEIKTFSRGGSDITGALVAAALDADVYENWTDVDGLMTTDPTCCPDAVCQSAVSYRQMRRLSRAGAQVLHPYCLEPVCEAGVPTLLRNTFHPEKPGTYISDRVHTTVPCICAQDGYRALKTDLLCEETQNILTGLRLDSFRSPDGESLIALQSPKTSIGHPAALVSVFGLPVRLHDEALLHSNCLGYLLDHDCLKLLVPPEEKIRCIRHLHDLFPK